MNIKGNLVTLRAIEHEDRDLLHKWSNDPEITYKLGGWHFPSSKADQLKWIDSLSLDDINKRFAIADQQSQIVGVANLVNINWKDRNAFHGILIGEESSRNKGYGRDAVMAICRFAFEELNFVRLDTTIIENNEPSINLFTKKCGWKIEGVKKNYYFRKNKWSDQLILGITSEDYYQLVKDTNYWNE
jgi:RimJ/RimL family protein N-acetyltransferase